MATCSRARLLGASALSIAMAGTPLASARACSVCLAGDPSFSTHGTTAQSAGDVSVYLELRGWEKRSGLLPHEEPEAGHDDDPAGGGSGGHADHGHEEPGEEHEEEPHGHEDGEEENTSQRLDLYVSWAPIDRVTLSLDVPWAFNAIVEREGEARARATLTGLGDIGVAASVVAWRNREVLPSTWLELRGLLEMPTGKSDEEVDGRRDPHLQPGSGSWDFGFGLAATHRLAWGALYGSVFRRWSGEGDLDYTFGDALLANAALEVPLGHALGRTWLERFTTGLELNFRYASRDMQRGEAWEDSGGAILFATPSLRVRLPAFGTERPPSLRVAVQIPTTQAWLHGDQHEDPVWSVGVLQPF